MNNGETLTKIRFKHCLNCLNIYEFDVNVEYCPICGNKYEILEINETEILGRFQKLYELLSDENEKIKLTKEQNVLLCCAITWYKKRFSENLTKKEINNLNFINKKVKKNIGD